MNTYSSFNKCSSWLLASGLRSNLWLSQLFQYFPHLSKTCQKQVHTMPIAIPLSSAIPFSTYDATYATEPQRTLGCCFWRLLVCSKALPARSPRSTPVNSAAAPPGPPGPPAPWNLLQVGRKALQTSPLRKWTPVIWGFTWKIRLKIATGRSSGWKTCLKI